MPNSYYAYDQRTFVWDTEKDEKNFRKHGITFKTAAKVFSDELRLEFPDTLHSNEEDRYIAIGLVHNILTVVYCNRPNEQTGNEDIRIISARIATKMEQVMYNNNLIGRF